MSTLTGSPIVVGVDGSAPALQAVRLAAREAALRERPLRVVHAFIWPLLHVPLGPSPAGPPEGGLRHDAEMIIKEAVAEATTSAPDIVVTADIVEGAAAAVLLHEAEHASMVVLGDRGLGGFTSLLVGSVAVQVSTHAGCPVLVARGAEHADGAVVVGIDGSPRSQLAIGFAIEAAALRRAELLALHCWTGPVSTGPGDLLPPEYSVADVVREEHRILAESLAGWSEQYPEVQVSRRVIHGSPARALVDASTTAQLVVVGARGRGAMSGLLLGSVSHAALHHAHCPVAILRSARRHG